MNGSPNKASEAAPQTGEKRAGRAELNSPGRAERHGFEYYRHGTLSFYAALNTKTSQVLAQTAPPHTSAEFMAFLEHIVASLPEGQQIHIIADNLSAHRTSTVWQFIKRHPQVRIHFTPDLLFLAEPN